MVWSQTRSDMRRHIKQPGESLPHLIDVGLHGGVDRFATMKLYNTLTDPGDKGILRTIVCNGVWTASSRSLLPQNAGMSNMCYHCESGAVETLNHLWWECPAWNASRRSIFENYPHDVQALNFAEWPQCALSCGIKNLDTIIPEGIITGVQSMMLNVFKAREVAKKSEF